MTGSGNGKLRLNFGNLPLIDVAVRVSLESPVNLTFRTVNDLAQELRADFPQLAELDQFRVPPGVEGTVTIGPGQIPGALYLGNKSGLTIAIQNQLIITRWAKNIFDSGAPDYPRFDALTQALWRAVGCFFNSLNGGAPRIAVVNMSYMNFLGVTHDLSILRYFSDELCIQLSERARRIHKFESSWEEPDGIDLRINLEEAHARMQAESVDGFRLTTAAGRLLAPGDSEQEALEQIHDRLQVYFLSILSDHAKSQWALEPHHA